jgi:hypothetical protein
VEGCSRCARQGKRGEKGTNGDRGNPFYSGAAGEAEKGAGNEEHHTMTVGGGGRQAAGSGLELAGVSDVGRSAARGRCRPNRGGSGSPTSGPQEIVPGGMGQTSLNQFKINLNDFKKSN